MENPRQSRAGGKERGSERSPELEVEVKPAGEHRLPCHAPRQHQATHCAELEPRLPDEGWHGEGPLQAWAACRGLALGWPELQGHWVASLVS